MKRNPKQIRHPEDKTATRNCLRIVEDRIELLRDCLTGKETTLRPLLLEHIQTARQRDEEMLAAIDKEIADIKSEVQELESQAKKFREEINGG